MDGTQTAVAVSPAIPALIIKERTVVSHSFQNHPAIKHILGLFDPGDWVCVKLIRGKEGDSDHQIIQWFESAENVATEEYIARCDERNRQGFNVYLCMNPLKPGAASRKKSDLRTIRNAYVEIDEDGEAALAKIRASKIIPRPTAIIESSPQRYQVIWAVEGFDQEQQEALNRALVKEFGGDPQATDCVRVLRLPGFRNVKRERPNKPMACIIEQRYGTIHKQNDFQITLEPEEREKFVAPDVIYEGEGRNSFILSLVSSLRAQNLADSTIRGAAESENDTKCVPPLDSEELKAVIKSGLRDEYKANDARWREEHRQKTESVLSLRVDDLTEFVKESLPVRPMLLAPFLAERTIGMIHAWRGVGKTHFMLGMAMATATGGKFLKWKAPEPSRVVYVDGELADEDIQLWAREIIAFDGMPQLQPGFFRLIANDRQERNIPSLLTPSGQAAIRDQIGDAKSLYLDNISTLFRGGDEKESIEWEAAQEWLIALRREGISVILAHHDGKQGLQRGTSKREDVMNWVIQLRRPANYQMEQGLRCEVHFEKARRLHGVDARPFETSLVTTPDGKLTWSVKEMIEALADQVRELRDGGLSFRDIGQQLGISKSKAERLAQRMSEQAGF